MGVSLCALSLGTHSGPQALSGQSRPGLALAVRLHLHFNLAHRPLPPSLPVFLLEQVSLRDSDVMQREWRCVMMGWHWVDPASKEGDLRGDGLANVLVIP